MFTSWLFQLKVWEYVLMQIFITIISAFLMLTFCCGIISCLTKCCFGEYLKEHVDVERGTGNGPKGLKKVGLVNEKKNGSTKSVEMNRSQSGAASIAVVTFKTEARSGDLKPTPAN